MSSITILSSAHALPATATAGKGAAADKADASALDFSALLGAGAALLSDAPGETPAIAATGNTAGNTTGKEGTTEESGSDPAAMLDAIAAAQATEPAPAAASPVPIVPALAPLPAAATARTTASGDAPAPASPRSTRPASPAAVSGESPAASINAAQTDAKGAPLPAKFDASGFTTRANVASERGAAGELRAEILARSVPDSQAATHLLHAQQPRHTHEVAPALQTLQQQIGTPAWNDGVAGRVVWMAKNDLQTAELHLNPADLGPIEITLTMSGDDKSQATVQFSAAHAGTREAIETALPRLREMLQENGITLGQAGVDANNGRSADGNDRQTQAGNTAARGHAGQPAGGPQSSLIGSTPLPAGTRVHGIGLVDTFA